MAWDFSTEPEFEEKLDWVKRFCDEKVEPLDHIFPIFPHAVRSPDPAVKAYVRELQQEVKDQGLWAIFLDKDLGGRASDNSSSACSTRSSAATPALRTCSVPRR